MEKSNFQLYKEEREGAIVIETEYGFATAIETDHSLYIDDIFIKKEFRKTNKASELADKLVIKAKELEYYQITGSVDTNANGAHTSLLVLIGYGMKLSHVHGSMIYFTKDI